MPLGSPLPYLLGRRRRAAGGVPVEPVLAPDFLAALVAYLRNYPSLEPLNGIANRMESPGFPYPFMIIDAITDMPLETNSPTTEIRQYRVQYTILTDTEGDAASLGRAAVKALSPRQKPYLVYTDGYEYQRTRMPGSLQPRQTKQTGRGGMPEFTVRFDMLHEVAERI